MGDGFFGRVALVTGGGSGIGRASCLAFAREGARVAVADVDIGGAEETVRLIEGVGGSGVGFRVDVTKSGEVESLVEKVVEEFGRLDCAFNNAGVGGEVMNTHEYPEDDWDRVIDVNLKGVWLCMKYEIPVMLGQGGGAIVNTASIYGLVGGGGIHCVQCGEARGGGGDEDGGAGVCGGRDTGERGLSGLHLDADDYPGHRGQP